MSRKISQEHLILNQRLKKDEIIIKQRLDFDEIQRSLGPRIYNTHG